MRLSRDDLKHVCPLRGIAMPAFFFFWSMIALVTRWTLLPVGGSSVLISGTGRGTTIEVVQGTTAVWIGLTWLGVALFLHGRYFWRWIEATHRAGIIVQWLGAILTGGMVVRMIVRAVVGA